MIEYKVIDVEIYTDATQNVLNALAKEGWRVVTAYSTCIILEREVRDDMGFPKNSTYSYYKVEI